MSWGGVDESTLDFTTGNMTPGTAVTATPPPSLSVPPMLADSQISNPAPAPSVDYSGMFASAQDITPKAPTMPTDPKLPYGHSPSVGNAQNASLPSPQQADTLLALGHIDTRQHKAIMDAYGLRAAQAGVAGSQKDAAAEFGAYTQAQGELAGKESDAIQAQADADTQKATQIADQHAAYQQRMNEHAEAQQIKEQQWQEQVAAKHSEIQKLVTDASRAKIDPEAARGSMGQRSVAGIAVALGAMGSAFTGGPNMAAQIIQQQIQDNLEAQKENINQKWKGVEGGRNELSDLRQQLGDERQADQVYTARQYQQYKDYLEGLNLQNAPEDAQRNAQMLKTHLEQKTVEGTHSAAQSWAQNNRQAYMEQGQLGAQRANLDMERQRLNIEAGKAGAKDAPKEVTDEISKSQEILDAIKEVRGHTKEGYAIGTERAHKAEAAAGQLRALIRDRFGIVRGKEGEKEIDSIIGGSPTGSTIKAIVPGMTSNGEYLTQLDMLEKTIKQQRKTRLGVHGINLPDEPQAPGRAL